MNDAGAQKNHLWASRVFRRYFQAIFATTAGVLTLFWSIGVFFAYQNAWLGKQVDWSAELWLSLNSAGPMLLAGGLLVALLLVAMLLAYLLARSFARPIIALRNGVKQIGDGDLNHRLPLATGDELQSVAQQFSELALCLRDSRRSLEARVEERTQASIEREGYLRMLMQSSGSGLLLVTREGEFRFANNRVCRMLGYQAGELNGSMFRELYIKPEDHDRCLENMDPAGSDKGINFETQLRGKDGSAIWVILNPVPVNVYGETLVAIWVNDVTELKRSEESMRVANAEQTAIFEAALMGIALVKRSMIVRANPQLEHLFGYGTGELVGASVKLLFPNVDDFWEFCDQNINLVEGRTCRNEVRLKRKDGSLFWCRLSGNVVEPQDFSRGVVWMLEDITEQRMVAETLARAKHHAEAATKAKSDFLANMSHEIRTPMNAIIGMSHLALQTELNRKQRNYIEKIQQAGDSLLGIINDILDFSKIEAGKLAIEHVDFDLDQVLNQFASLLNLKSEDRSLEFLFDIQHDVPIRLIGDPLRLGQILLNLGNNAIKFTQQGEIVLAIDKQDESGDQVELHFLMRDTGIGMSEEQCNKLFQSFSQADASTTRKYGGTGLGLAISKQLVELMGGRMWVESALGQGSEFHFQIRLGQQQLPEQGQNSWTASLRGQRILVVDGHPHSRQILADLAASLGLAVQVAADGQEALSRLLPTAVETTGEEPAGEEPAGEELAAFDLLLMDWQLPIIDGLALLTRLQPTSAARLPVILLGYGREDVLAAAERHGLPMPVLLAKPVTRSSLLNALLEARNKESHAHEATAATSSATFTANSTTANSAAANSQTSQDLLAVRRSLQGARVLLVEDNDVNQELIVELLAHAGMTVEIAGNGQEALDFLASDAGFDAVLMDCQMPVMDGYTATCEMKKRLEWQALPVIAMTANAMAGDREKALAVGMVDHIAKPIQVSEMYATLCKWIKPARPAQTAATQALGNGSGPLRSGQSQPGTPPQTVPSDLPGVEVADGLARTMGNQTLYRKLLQKFAEGQRSFVQQFSALLTEGDRAGAERATHTLKGSSGTLGARTLQAAAASLEAATVKGGKPEVLMPLLQAVQAALSQVIEGIDAMSAAQSDMNASQQPKNLEKIQAKLAKLKSLIEDSDIDACELADELAGEASGTAYAEPIDRVVHDLMSYDFDEALKIINRLMQ